MTVYRSLDQEICRFIILENVLTSVVFVYINFYFFFFVKTRQRYLLSTPLTDLLK